VPNSKSGLLDQTTSVSAQAPPTKEIVVFNTKQALEYNFPESASIGALSWFTEFEAIISREHPEDASVIQRYQEYRVACDIIGTLVKARNSSMPPKKSLNHGLLIGPQSTGPIFWLVSWFAGAEVVRDCYFSITC
jgi:hypothetical protein